MRAGGKLTTELPGGTFEGAERRKNAHRTRRKPWCCEVCRAPIGTAVGGLEAGGINSDTVGTAVGELKAGEMREGNSLREASRSRWKWSRGTRST